MLRLFLPVLVLPLVQGAPAQAQDARGVYVEGFSRMAVFDANTDTVLASVPMLTSDCMGIAILADLSLAFVTNRSANLYVLDLAADPPTFASGTNPIPLSGFAQNVAVSPDQKFLVITTLASGGLVSIVDVAARVELRTYAGSPRILTDAEIAPDGSVLMAGLVMNSVDRFRLTSTGKLRGTGDLLHLPGSPVDVVTAPGGAHAISVCVAEDRLVSHTVGGLDPVDEVALPNAPTCGAFAPSGDRFFVLSTALGQVVVEAYPFDPLTGVLGDTALWLRTFAYPGGCSDGAESLAVHPDGSKLFVDLASVTQIEILSPADGASLGGMPIGGGDRGGIAVMQRAECYLVLGDGAGSTVFHPSNHAWTTQLGGIHSSYPVTMESIPSFPLPPLPHRFTTLPVKVAEIDAQLLMWNPSVFPDNPEQWSRRLHVTAWSNGKLDVWSEGSENGIEIDCVTHETANGERFARFPFVVEGL